jgi:hypothetical protein
MNYILKNVKHIRRTLCYTRTQEQSNKPIRYLIYGALLLLLFGCSDSYTPLQSNEEEKQVNVISSVIISDSENDPYTVENMNKALRMSIAQKKGVAVASIDENTYKLEPNFLYVRFLANGKQGEAELKKYDTSLVLFKHPMDYKPIQKPAVYIDPSLPDSVIPYFATVPVDYVFGPTKYEVIKELFLVEPDEYDKSDSLNFEKALLKKKRGVSQTTASKLLDLGVSLREIEWTSLKMTDNLKHRLKSEDSKLGESPKMAWSLFSSGKKLGGQLKFEDDILGVQPLVGVRVTGGYSYYWREAHTDKDGKFKIPEKWNFDIDYEANFDSDDFLLEDGHSAYGEDLEIEKNDKHSDWKETFTGNKAKWCVVWTAAYQYWYGEIYGLKRPRQNELWNWSMDIEVYYKNEKDYKNLFSSSFIGCNAGESVGQYASAGVFENICILAYKRFSYEIYGTTIHEIAHSSHFSNMKTTSAATPQAGEFELLSDTYKETYARGIENYFINKRYNNGIDEYRRRDYDYQYTGLVEDLMGTNPKSKCKDSRISGFHITSIETAFFKNKKFSSMKKYLLNKNSSGVNGVKYTAESIDNLFKCWGL